LKGNAGLKFFFDKVVMPYLAILGNGIGGLFGFLFTHGS
jgi:hypothetical protein